MRCRVRLSPITTKPAKVKMFIPKRDVFGEHCAVLRLSWGLLREPDLISSCSGFRGGPRICNVRQKTRPLFFLIRGSAPNGCNRKAVGLYRPGSWPNLMPRKSGSPGSHKTPRWREPDSNHRSPRKGQHFFETAADLATTNRPGGQSRILTIDKGRFTVRRARLAPAMISTPGHRASRRRQRGALPAWSRDAFSAPSTN
jgi:hypothetical protein